MIDSQKYVGREQAYVKHFVLEHYLEQLTLKVGQFRAGTTFNYVDGFSGPWQASTQDLSDTSPHIALSRLSAVRTQLATRAKPIDFVPRCLFVEKDPAAFAKLRALPSQFADVEAITLNGEFESIIENSVGFAECGANAFAFAFIDPTGWTGYGLRAITPLLRVKRGEVLINFMTKDISRFIDDADSTALSSFVDLFGDAHCRDAWRGLEGDKREDAIVEKYCQRLSAAGGYRFCGSTVVLNPTQDRTHYHLIYATRSLVGLITFRETERRAIAAQRDIRASTRQQQRVLAGQGELFTGKVMETRYVEDLAGKYRSAARQRVEAKLQRERTVSYDDLVALALAAPMTSEAELKEWLEDLRRAGQVEAKGLGRGERVPKIRKGHRIVSLVPEAT